jgi:hypothetical protein
MRVLFHIAVIVPIAILALASFLIVFAIGLTRDVLTPIT